MHKKADVQPGSPQSLPVSKVVPPVWIIGAPHPFIGLPVWFIGAPVFQVVPPVYIVGTPFLLIVLPPYQIALPPSGWGCRSGQCLCRVGKFTAAFTHRPAASRQPNAAPADRK